MIDGWGNSHFGDGASYTGEHAKGFRNGWGTYHYSKLIVLRNGSNFNQGDGRCYEGEWVNGDIQGRGILHQHQLTYVGQWEASEYTGYGEQK